MSLVTSFQYQSCLTAMLPNYYFVPCHLIITKELTLFDNYSFLIHPNICAIGTHASLYLPRFVEVRYDKDKADTITKIKNF